MIWEDVSTLSYEELMYLFVAMIWQQGGDVEITIEELDDLPDTLYAGFARDVDEQAVKLRVEAEGSVH